MHGPLQAMLLMQAACRRRGALPLRFRFRGVRPLFHFDTVRLQAQAEALGSQTLASVNGEGLACMQAQIGWA